jgi:hypothetical protein
LNINKLQIALSLLLAMMKNKAEAAREKRCDEASHRQWAYWVKPRATRIRITRLTLPGEVNYAAQSGASW